ncbi:MAG: IMP cyclohydrolase [Deltaproteobacteria bacterium]|nr:IMP cyclohydrolase [Deltaproteobacteria bacterium]
MPDDIKKMYKSIAEEHFPQQMEISFVNNGKKQTLYYDKVTWTIDGVSKGLRYGENPGQPAALYKPVNGNLILSDTKTIAFGKYLVSDVQLLQAGKHPGKTNLTDTDNALNILRYLNNKPCAVIVKHNNPCGVAQDETLFKAYQKAYMADRIAAFGGCIALNRPIDKITARLIAEQYAEVIAAPDFEEGSFEILASRKNLRIIQIENIANLENFIGKPYLDFKSLIDGGIIAQIPFTPNIRSVEMLKSAETEYNGKRYAIKREPTEKEAEDMLFGWLVEAGITSNSVIYVKDLTTVGIGTGEQDRVGVAEIARDKAYKKLADKYCYQTYKVSYNELEDYDKKEEIKKRVEVEKGGLKNAVMVSDAFFPFVDGVKVGIKEKILSVIQPGGAGNDWQVIEECNKAGVTMVFTGQRSFKH